jgi:hypothetical protein
VSLKRVLIAFPALVALGWMAAQALRIGTADAIVYDASKEMSTWSAARSSPAEQMMGWVHEDLQRAALQVPGDATIHELLGILQMRRVERPEYLDEASVHFTKALALRPTSAYAWASLADARYRSGDTSNLFEAALRRAVEMGPNEPEVQRTVADYGLAMWREVAPATRTAVEVAIANGMRRNPLETLRIAERRGRLGIACRYISDVELCESTGATP